MKRLARYDFAARFEVGLKRLSAQVLFGFMFAVGMIVIRSLLDLGAPTAGPFALVYPTVLLATLYGHWQAGITAYLVSFCWAWYFVLPTSRSFLFEIATDPARVAINAFAALIIVILAESFRRAVRSTISERDTEIDKQVMLREELEHRTRNNFALAISLLQQQKREDNLLSLEQSLDQAIGRLRSFAEAYAHLAEAQGEGANVSMQPYLKEIVSNISNALFGTNIGVSMDLASCVLRRETAVAIGLFVNETLTNCAKYAFPDARQGRVEVTFRGDDRSWIVEVADNGVGATMTNADRSSGLGTRLLNAFAAQASAEFQLEVSELGRKVRLVAEKNA